MKPPSSNRSGNAEQALLLGTGLLLPAAGWIGMQLAWWLRWPGPGEWMGRLLASGAAPLVAVLAGILAPLGSIVAAAEYRRRGGAAAIAAVLGLAGVGMMALSVFSRPS